MVTNRLKEAFGAAMAQFGPFPDKPGLAAAVSGGADSTALALLAQEWALTKGGTVLALIVDHGLRPASGAEANITRQRLEARGFSVRVLSLSGLSPAKLQDGARRARHAALSAAARDAGALFLLFGHHAADQRETVAMRARRGDSGLAGMAGWTARNDIVFLRPLLGLPQADLRAYLRARDMAWIEDPSNHDRRFERVRVRIAGGAVLPSDAAARKEVEDGAATFLASHAIIRPEGFAVVQADAAPPAALAALIRTVGGARYAPGQAAVAALAARLRPSTLGGVRIMDAGRLGPGWLLAREAAYCAGPVPAERGRLWDGRFRLLEHMENCVCGALGADAVRFRDISDLPAAVLSGLPCIRPLKGSNQQFRLAKAVFVPPEPARGSAFPLLSRGPFSG